MVYWRDAFKYRPRSLEQTLAAERSRYLNEKINAAIGLCPEPSHPLDSPEPPKSQLRPSAAHRFDLIERNRKAATERLERLPCHARYKA
jgi:hypothetical protein